MVPPTPTQVPLTPSVRTYDGSVSALSGRSGCAAYDSQHHQARDNLTHFLAIVSLTESLLLVKDGTSRLSTIFRIFTAECAELESLLLLYGSAPSLDDIEELILLV